MSELLNKVYACLLGGLIGDAMGAPVEGMTYLEIEGKHGWVDTFEGAGTDDSAVKHIIIRALNENDGHITCDELADSFLKSVAEKKEIYDLFYIPVRNMFEKLKEQGVVTKLYLRDGMMHTWMIIPNFAESKKDLAILGKDMHLALNGKLSAASEPVKLD